MSKIESKLQEHWPVDRVIVSCNVCDEEIYDSEKMRPITWDAYFIANLIEIFTRKHHSQTHHADICIDLDKKRNAEREIDCEITIND